MKKILGITAGVLLQLSCQADFKNNIPDNQKDILAVHRQVRELLTSPGATKLWIVPGLKINSSPLPTIGLSIAPGSKTTDDSSSFTIGYWFKDNENINVYVSILNELQYKANSNSAIYDNPNTYKVSGDLRTEITILSKGILSEMKQRNIIDFSYVVKSYSKDIINLETLYPKYNNKGLSLFLHDANDFFDYLRYTEVFHSAKSLNLSKENTKTTEPGTGTIDLGQGPTIKESGPIDLGPGPGIIIGGTSSSGVISGIKFSKLDIVGPNGKNIASFEGNKSGEKLASSDTYGENFIHQYYDEEASKLAFRMVADIPDIDATTDEGLVKYLMEDLNIKYLERGGLVENKQAGLKGVVLKSYTKNGEGAEGVKLTFWWNS